jgi:protein involved in sex pheromone biosynthesis
MNTTDKKPANDILDMIRARQNEDQLTPNQSWTKIINKNILQEQNRQRQMVTDYDLDFYTREEIIEAALQLGVRIGQDYDNLIQADCVIAENLSQKIAQVGMFLQEQYGTQDDIDE